MEHPCSFTSSPLSQHPIPAANRNSDCPFCQDHSEIWELYKPAQIDPSQDLTATRIRDNISGFGFSSPALQQPPTKPFSGPPSRHHLIGPYREAREAGQQRPGLLCPLLPRDARQDTQLEVDAALPEEAALDRRLRPPTVLDIADPSQTEGEQPDRRRTPARTLAATQTTLTPFLQAMPEPLHWSLQAQEALPTTRPLV